MNPNPATPLPGPMPAETLQPVDSRGRLPGLGNLTRKELGGWWHTRLWWSQAILWLAMINGIQTLVMLDASVPPAERVPESVSSFMGMVATLVGIGVIVTLQGAIVGEKELGTAAWIISKPVARSSFVLSKLFAHTIGILALGVVVPTMVYLAQANRLLTEAPAADSLLRGAAVIALSVLFYLTLTLALGATFSGRGPVAGVGVGMVISGMFFKGLVPMAIVKFTPWLLADIASALALGDELPPDWWVPVASTAAAAIAFVWIAIARFGREEF